jgi:hypothetical protein
MIRAPEKSDEFKSRSIFPYAMAKRLPGFNVFFLKTKDPLF